MIQFAAQTLPRVQRSGDAAAVRKRSLALLLAACSSPPPAAPPNTVAGPAPDVPVARQLPAGTVLRLLPVSGLADDRAAARAVDGWWHEALRQSDRFDVAAGIDDVGAVTDLLVVPVQCHVDQQARTLAATLLPGNGAPMALAGAEFRSMPLPAAIDRLAWTTRLALGERAAAPISCTACTSADPQVVALVEDAMLQLSIGNLDSARRLLEQARRRDGGSPYVLEALAAVRSLLGDASSAQRIAIEALGYPTRLSPTVQHRLTRTLLLARASEMPQRASQTDQELLLLGRVARRERPFDPQCRITEALAHNFLGDFAAARDLLVPLSLRLPHSATVHYHLGWSWLGLGNATAASIAFDAAAPNLPLAATFVPRALARYEAGDHDGLRALFVAFEQAPGVAENVALHQLRRMEAAHALLQDRTEDAAKLLLADLAWLQQRPSLLDRHAGELADQGEVLVRIGHGAELPTLLAAIAAQQPNAAVADACAFLGGMVEVAQRGQRAQAVEGALARGGLNAWSAVLQAYGHRQQGEIADEYAALLTAARLSQAPLIKAALVRSLRAMGRATEAEALKVALQRELRAIHLRQRLQHPLLGPELALAFSVQ